MSTSEHDTAVKDRPDQRQDGEHPDQFVVKVTYNGVTKPFEVKATELVKTLLTQAIATFGITQNTHLLGLFTPQNDELSDDKTIREAGVHPEEKLLLRPSAVRAGGK
jgi:hypothetical protein